MSTRILKSARAYIVSTISNFNLRSALINPAKDFYNNTRKLVDNTKKYTKLKRHKNQAEWSFEERAFARVAQRDIRALIPFSLYCLCPGTFPFLPLVIIYCPWMIPSMFQPSALVTQGRLASAKLKQTLSENVLKRLCENYSNLIQSNQSTSDSMELKSALFKLLHLKKQSIDDANRGLIFAEMFASKFRNSAALVMNSLDRQSLQSIATLLNGKKPLIPSFYYESYKQIMDAENIALQQYLNSNSISDHLLLAALEYRGLLNHIATREQNLRVLKTYLALPNWDIRFLFTAVYHYASFGQRKTERYIDMATLQELE